MEDLRPDALAARVVAWHNRHPLARRISAARVQSIGYVALPYVAAAAAGSPASAPVATPPGAAAADPAPEPPAGGTLRERAVARARQPEAAPPPPVPAAAAPPGALSPAFSEDFIPPLRPAQVARWALRHGRAAAGPPASAPLRLVEIDAARAAGGTLQRLYVLTALIETGGQRTRLLVGAGTTPPVLGRRLWSRPRLAGAAAALLAAVGVGLVLTFGLDGPAVNGSGTPPLAAAPASTPQAAASAAPEASRVAAVVVAPAPAQAPAPVTAAPASAPAPEAAVPPPAAEPAAPAPPPAPMPKEPPAVPRALPVAPPVPASAPAANVAAPMPAATSAPAAAPSTPLRPAGQGRPPDVDPRFGRVELPPIAPPPIRLPSRDEARAAAWAQVARPGQWAPKLLVGPSPASAPGLPQTRVALPQAAPASTPASAAASIAAPPPPASAPVAVRASAYALSTRLLRTRAESEQVMAAMRSLLLAAGERGVQVEIVAHGEDWRVVAWPFPRHADADKARSVLASRGMRVQVVDF